MPRRASPQVDEHVVGVQRLVLAVDIVGIEPHQLIPGRDEPVAAALGPGTVVVDPGHHRDLASSDIEHLKAELVAEKIGMPYEKVFKTLLLRGDVSGLCLAVIPANTEVNLKALAQTTGDRKVHMVPLKEVQPLTGYIRGGV